jgi:hypothetical protein
MADKVKVRWLGTGSKTVSVPCPFVSLSEKTGEVICAPVGEFDEKDAEYLVGLNGLFILAEQPALPEPKPEPKKSFTEKIEPAVIEDKAAPPPGKLLKIETEMVNTTFATAGVATMQRNKYFPNAEVVKRDGKYHIMQRVPSPSKETAGTQA